MISVEVAKAGRNLGIVAPPVHRTMSESSGGEIYELCMGIKKGTLYKSASKL